MIRAAALLALVVLTGCAAGGPVLDANGNAAVLKQAQELRRADRSAQAAAIVQRALLTTAPGNVALQGELARDLIFADPARALDLIGQAFDPAAPDAKLLMIGGVANDLLGRHAEAQALYAEGLKITPDDPAIRTNIEISRRMIADENHIVTSKRVIATPTPKPIKRVAKIAPPQPSPAPVPVIAPEPAPSFQQRWRLL